MTCVNMPPPVLLILGVWLMLVLFLVRVCQLHFFRGSKLVITVIILALSSFIEQRI